MQVKLRNGQKVKINLTGNRLEAATFFRSKFQQSVADYLRQEYPQDLIFTEVHIPGEGFVLDFFIPSMALVVEAQGIQHTEHVRFFHPTIRDFHNQQDRDSAKGEWCAINKFRLMEFHPNEAR
jgi:very-short-patch-repair endonuclease